jgi:type IV pilus assembly protein PilY1
VTDLLSGISSSPSSVMGWYFDLPVTSNIASRVNVDPFATGGIVAFIGNLPNGSACTPSGTGTTYAVNFANGKTVLQNSTATSMVASIALDGLGTEVVVVNVGGKQYLYSGSSKGTIINDPAKLQTTGSVVQINWRDLPTTN